jgi:hypothetical protein
MIEVLEDISLPFTPTALLTDKTFRTYHLRQTV